MKNGHSDKIDLCRQVFGGLWLLTVGLAAVIFLFSYSARHTDSPDAGDFIERFDLNILSIVPSGQPLRNPQSTHPGVDLRMLPALPPVSIDSGSLLLHVK